MIVGTQIGNYRIDEKIGEGGMGTVYRAMEVNLERPVAIKVLNANVLRNPALAERFRAEARAQANLNHTNIATLYTLLIHEDSAMMVMEFVQGENFQQLVARRGPIDAEEAIPLFQQALLGIGCAHRVGIVHRDIKPANLMVNHAGVVKVMDFGIAKAVGERGMTRTGLQVGTVHYMSPEQVKSDPVDARSDIYALGITLYEMLSGRVPFDANSEFEVLTDHVKTAPPLPSLFCRRISKGLENIVLKALEKDPEDRFQSVEEFGAALEKPERWEAYVPKSQQRASGLDLTQPLSYDRALFDSPTKAPVDSLDPPPPPPTAAQAASRKRHIWIGAAIAIVLLAIAGFIGYKVFAAKPAPAAVSDGKPSASLPVPLSESAQAQPETAPPAGSDVPAAPAPQSPPPATAAASRAPLPSKAPASSNATSSTPVAENPPPPLPAPIVVPPEPQQSKPVARQITVPAAQEIEVRLNGALDSASVQPGQDIEATVNVPVLVNEHLAIPKGASAQVHVVDVSKAGRFKGAAHLTLTLKSITIAGHVHTAETDVYDAAGASRGKRTGKFGIFGALVGGVTHGSKGTAEGVGAGGGSGTAAPAATGATGVALPAESLVSFHLVAPLIIGK